MKITFIESCFLKALKDANKESAEILSALIVAIAMTAMTIIGNSFMFIVFIKSRSLQTPANILLAFLCFFDLLVGLTVYPVLVAILARDDLATSKELVSIFLYLVSLCDGFSIITVTFISLDRYIAVCFPFAYERLASVRNSIILLSSTNTVWLMLSFLFFVYEITLLYICTVLEFVIFLTVLFCYVCIYYIIRKQKRSVVTLGTINGSQSCAVILRRNQEGKKSKTIAIVLLFFYICFLPSYIYLIFLLIQRKCDNELHASLWILFPTLANSAANPFIYYLSRVDIREEAKRMLKRNPASSSSSFGGRPREGDA